MILHDDTQTDVTDASPPRWKPGSLSSVELDIILTDALADTFADCWRRGDDTSFQRLAFRERVERAVEYATGIALCGLPAAFRAELEPTVRVAAAAEHHHPLNEAGHKVLR